MRRPVADLLRLYLVTDPGLTLGRDVADIVARACAAGATLVQHRDKESDDDAYLATARRLAEAAHAYGVPLLLNDRVHLVRASEADGVHVGQDDLPVAEVRRLLGPEALIGVSVATVEQARAARDDGADYIAVSGVFATATKAGITGDVGLDGIAPLVAAGALPSVAIGGVKAENAAAVTERGVDGVAVVTAITLADDIETAVRNLLDAVAEGARRRYAADSHRPVSG